MKTLFLIAFNFALLSLTAVGQCGDVTQLPAQLIKTPSKGLDVVSTRNSNQITSLLERSITGARGGKITIYPFTSGKVDVPGTVFGYTTAMYLLQFNCDKGSVKPEPATDMWLYVGVNQIPFFTSNNDVGSERYVLPNGQKMYYSNYQVSGKFKGMDMFGPLGHSNAKAVIISNHSSVRLPLRTVTRRELLVPFRAGKVAEFDGDISRTEKIVANEAADLARLDRDPGLQNREAAKRSLVENNQRLRGILEKKKAERASCLKAIDDHATGPNASKPAYVGFNGYCDPAKFFSDGPTNQTRAVTVFDESFFSKRAAGEPQFFVVYWREPKKGSNAVKEAFIEKFLENFDFAALRSMLAK